MSDALYSNMEHAKYRGPTSSDKYNERIENAYKDLVVLLNRIGITSENVDKFYSRMIKERLSLVKVIEDLEERVIALEGASNKSSFYTIDQVDTGRFVGTDFEVNDSEHLFHDYRHGIITLPKLEAASISKLRFVNSDNKSVIPPSFEAIASGIAGTADSTLAVIDQSSIVDAVIPDVGVMWERNVVVGAPNVDGAQMNVYFRLPPDLSVNENTNTIVVHPFPMMGVKLVSVGYTTSQQVFLSENDNYISVNSKSYNTSNQAAVGWIAPGGWNGDTINDCGPKIFQFPSTAVTAVRITLRQDHYFYENNKYVYSYGLSNFDVRYDKYNNTGKMIVRFDAPSGDTISSIDSVEPQIWNINPAELARVFSYRVLWETSYGSGTYTTTPVAFSKRVWLEVTLRQTVDGTAPALSGLSVSYS